jgi:pyridoxine kinase
MGHCLNLSPRNVLASVPMAKVLSVSSQVVYGHVGNSVTAFVMQRLGHEVWSVPTIVLSNRPDYKAAAGLRIPPADIDAMLEAGLANGWVAQADAVMTGYLPSAEHVELCARWVSRLKSLRPQLVYLCDPVLGDEPGGMYIDPAAAAALRDMLLPLADIATPNRFELGWLTGRDVSRIETAMVAARTLNVPTVLATSLQDVEQKQLTNLVLCNGAIHVTTVARTPTLAHGTGDFIAAAFMARLLDGENLADALSFATSATEVAISASYGADELLLIPSQDRWTKASPARLSPSSHLKSILQDQ